MTKIRKTRNATTPNIAKRLDLEILIPKGYRKNSPWRRFSATQLLIVLVLVIFAIFLGNFVGQESISKTWARVVSVSDGDTVRVEYANGTQENIRLIGVDTPETHHPTKPVGCFGPEAENFTRSNLNGKEIQLEYDVERLDRYERTLAYIYINGERFNDILIEQGYGKVLSIEPNTRYANQQSKLEIQAKSSRLGLWGYCVNAN